MRRETTRIGHFRAPAVLAAALAAALAVGLLALAEPAQATFPGTNGKISFTRLNDVFTMDANGSNQTRLTSNPLVDDQSAISADGTKIAFVSSRDGNKPEIYTMNADGSNQTRLTNAGNPVHSDGNPTWSPDGSKISFHRTVAGSPSSNTDVFVMNAIPESASNLPVRLTDNPARDEEATWSPDGSKIAFTSLRDGNAEIYVMDESGNNETNLSNNFAGTGVDLSANFSPDGDQIVFESDRTLSGGRDIYVMDTDPLTNDAARLTNNTAHDQHPAFSPDGDQIVFQSGRDGTTNIHVMDTDPLTADTGTAVTRLGGGSQPDWAPAPADTTPPNTTITRGPSGATSNDSVTSDTTPFFTFISSEANSTFECRLTRTGETPGSFASCSSGDSFGPLTSDGGYIFEVQAIDPAGNEDSTPDSRSFTLDTTSPETTIDTGPSDPTNDTTPTFTFSSPESGATFQCSLDGAPFSECSSPRNLTLIQGEHTFRVQALDAVGNADRSPAERAFTVDTTAPTVLDSSLKPANRATNVRRKASVTATFSEEMNPDTLTTSTVTLVNSKNSVAVTADVKVTLNSEGKTVVTIDPVRSLATKTKYIVTIKGGSSGVKDLAGNTLAANKVWTFTTGLK